LSRFRKPLPGGAGFASLLSLCGGQHDQAGFHPTLTWSSWIGGMDALPDLVLPRHGRWHVADTQPLALDAYEDISYLRTCPWIFT
jgi:hypothetical protein